jgi:hypothetical protein
MAQATPLWPLWPSLLSSFAWTFTRFGFRWFAERITALAITPEEHTITIVGRRHRADRRLKGPGELRRVRLVADGLRDRRADPYA